jgi:hypothetical protein
MPALPPMDVAEETLVDSVITKTIAMAYTVI